MAEKFTSNNIETYIGLSYTVNRFINEKNLSLPILNPNNLITPDNELEISYINIDLSDGINSLYPILVSISTDIKNRLYIQKFQNLEKVIQGILFTNLIKIIHIKKNIDLLKIKLKFSEDILEYTLEYDNTKKTQTLNLSRLRTELTES